MKQRVFWIWMTVFLLTNSLWAGILDEYKKARQFMNDASANNVEAVRKLIPYLGDSKPILRDGAFMAIRKNITDSGAIRFLAQSLLQQKNVLIRENIAELLGKIGAEEKDIVGKVLLAALKRDKVSVRVEAARALGNLEYAKAAKALERLAKRSGPWLLRGEALDALVKIQGKEALKVVQKLLKDRDPIVRGYALLLLAKLDVNAALDSAIEMMKKTKPKKIRLKGWQPVFAAFLVVEKAAHEGGSLEKVKEAITQMIELLKGLEGRIFYNNIQFLSRITGEVNLIPSYRDWKAWWALNKSRFQLPKDRGESKEAGLKRPPRTVVRYHGIPIYSTRIVFMVDHSGSMRNRLGEGDNKGKIKFDVCKEELIKTVRSLDKRVFFNIFFLESTVFSWKKQLTQAKPRNKRAAIKYVSSVSATKPLGSRYKMRGNFYDALYKALMDPYADTIFLLSDGGPTAGKYAFPERVLEKVNQLNRFLHFEIHTILIGASQAKAQRFMESLAKSNYGKFHLKGGKKYGRRKKRKRRS